jgi:hypothetical protein
MLGVKLKGQSKRSIACCLGEKSYSLAGIKNNSELLFWVRKDFEDKGDLFAKSFAEDVERFDLLGASCRVVLAPGQYQLLLMDALEVPEEEMAKAIRWRLKGLVEYPINDIALDVFIVPPHGVVGTLQVLVVIRLRTPASTPAFAKLIASVPARECALLSAPLINMCTMTAVIKPNNTIKTTAVSAKNPACFFIMHS